MAQGTTKKEKNANAFNKFSQKTFDNNNFYKIFVAKIIFSKNSILTKS